MHSCCSRWARCVFAPALHHFCFIAHVCTTANGEQSAKRHRFIELCSLVFLLRVHRNNEKVENTMKNNKIWAAAERQLGHKLESFKFGFKANYRRPLSWKPFRRRGEKILKSHKLNIFIDVSQKLSMKRYNKQFINTTMVFHLGFQRYLR